MIIVTAIGEAPQAGIENSGVVLESPENAGDGPESSPEVHANTPVLERIQAIAQDAAGEEASVLVASSLDAVARSLSERIDQGLASVTGWLASQTAGISPTLKTLGLTVATVCGLIGLALGLASAATGCSYRHLDCGWMDACGGRFGRLDALERCLRKPLCPLWCC